MPIINPGIVAASPFLTDIFHISTQEQTVGANGRSTTTPTHTKARGLVVQAGKGDLEIYPELARAAAAISVTSRFQMRGPTPGQSPDVITWRGTSYLVVKCLPAPHLGSGFWKVLATSQNAVNIMPGEVDE